MIRKAIIVVLTLLAVATGGSCLRTALSNWWWFSFGEVLVEFEDSALIVSSGGMFLVDQPLLWAYPYLIRARIGVWVLTVPLWIPFILFSSYPALAFIRGPLRRWRRRRKGLCVKCGYNLTGLPEPRCPECGTEFER